MKRFVHLAVLSLAFAGSAHALTNEQFAKEVQRQVAAFEKDEKAATAARQFCSSLSEARRGEEPRCVALQRLARGGAKFTPSPARKW